MASHKEVRGSTHSQFSLEHQRGLSAAWSQRSPKHYADHLNTPRLVADATATTVWRWDQAEPFGVNAANEDPDGNSVAFDLPLRLPGQYYDKEHASLLQRRMDGRFGLQDENILRAKINYAYSPYGEVAVLGPDGGNDLQYAGLRNDGTGLYQAVNRYYDPILKQWISEDPIGLAGGVNQYAYVEGDPISLTDPMGLFDSRRQYPGTNPYPKCAGSDAACRAGLTRANSIGPKLSGTVSANVPLGPLPVGVALSCTFDRGGMRNGFIGVGPMAGGSLGVMPRVGATGNPSSAEGIQFGTRINGTVPAVPGTTLSGSQFYPLFGPPGDPQVNLQIGGGASASVTYGLRW